jgi:hypothetical protein
VKVEVALGANDLGHHHGRVRLCLCSSGEKLAEHLIADLAIRHLGVHANTPSSLGHNRAVEWNALIQGLTDEQQDDQRANRRRRP